MGASPVADSSSTFRLTAVVLEYCTPFALVLGWLRGLIRLELLSSSDASPDLAFIAFGAVLRRLEALKAGTSSMLKIV